MSLEKTPNGLEYAISKSSINGNVLSLYAIIGVTSDENVRQAKQWLYRKRAVLGIQVRWKKEDDVEFLEAATSSQLAKGMKIELGRKDSYIEELEHKLRKLEAQVVERSAQLIMNQATKEERTEIKKTQIYQEQQKTIKQLEKTIERLRKDNSDLITKLNAKQINQSNQL
jgi:hypothetical protein